MTSKEGWQQGGAGTCFTISYLFL